MSDTVFRSKAEQTEAKEPEIEAKTPAMSDTTQVEAPYLDSPEFLDSYFNLGTEWHDHDATFYPELTLINDYLTAKIKEGTLSNDKKAVNDYLKGLEKLTNLKGETRSVVKLEVLGNYVEFLMKNEQLKSNLKRYAN